MRVLACFPAGRDDPVNRGRFVLKLSRSGINHNRSKAGCLLNTANSLSTTTQTEVRNLLKQVSAP